MRYGRCSVPRGSRRELWLTRGEPATAGRHNGEFWPPPALADPYAFGFFAREVFTSPRVANTGRV